MRVVLVVGMHPAARRRTVDALLAVSTGSVAVHHDMSDIGEGAVRCLTWDGDGTSHSSEVSLAHPCASCTLRESLLPLLVDLAAQGRHDLCVVEAWDTIEPQLISETIADQPSLRLTGVVTAVQAELATDDLRSDDELADRGLDIAEDDERSVSEVLARQVEYASVITVQGTADLERTQALLGQLNPAAALTTAGPALAELCRGRFDTDSAAARCNPAWAQYGDRAEGRVRTLAWTRTRPLHPQRFADALERITSFGLRGRGRFWLAGQDDTLLVWESYGDLMVVENAGPWLGSLPEAALDLVPQARRLSAQADWLPEIGDRRQHIAFTGIDLDVPALTALLDSCLVDEAEPVPQRQSDPFTELLER
ncbi:GTP-binding protein [Nocardiopsis sp. CNT312]|uniref:CobW family GTP-binding protein n=1 Tax=Nocardiopsis sp. CNT312 TaxID=1137268 RepID=UPI00049067E2|nr:GTP-binding protein [Nocardiopsis sp. CNT312]